MRGKPSSPLQLFHRPFHLRGTPRLPQGQRGSHLPTSRRMQGPYHRDLPATHFDCFQETDATRINFMPVTSLLIITYKRDFRYLVFCVRSLNKFLRGFEEVVILFPETDWAEFTTQIGPEIMGQDV